MLGKRLPLLEGGKLNLPQNPGEYCGPVTGYNGKTGEALMPAVYFLKPTARDPGAPPRARAVQFVVSPPHVFTEEPDGSLTITASISDHAGGGSESDGWHGYLTKGVWRIA